MNSAGKVKIVHIITRLILGGAQEDTLLLVNGLKSNPKYKIFLVSGPAIGPEGELISRARKLNIDLTIIPEMRRNIYPIKDFISFIKLYRLIRKLKPDIVHTHSSKAGILGRLAARLAGVKIVVHSIYGLAFHPFQNKLVNVFYILLEKFCARYTDKLLSIADAMTKQTLDAGVGKAEQFQTVRSAIELDKFLNIPDRSKELREKYKIKESDKVIGVIARLAPLKGHEYLMEIAPKILEKFNQVKFLLVGDGVLRYQICDMAKKKGIIKNIIFTGHVKPDLIPHLINLMDILVHPSLREGLARALPQALLLKKPVVSFALDGAGEVVIDNKTGFLIPPKDLNRLYSSIITLLENQEKAYDMGLEGYNMVKDWFDSNKMVNDINKLYDNLLEFSDNI